MRGPGKQEVPVSPMCEVIKHPDIKLRVSSPLFSDSPTFLHAVLSKKEIAKYALISIMVDCLSRLIIVITINIGFQVVREEGPPEDTHSPCPREASPPQVRGVRQELQSELQSQQTHEGNHYSNTDIRKTLFQYSSSLYKPLDAESLYSNSDNYGVFFI